MNPAAVKKGFVGRQVRGRTQPKWRHPSFPPPVLSEVEGRAHINELASATRPSTSLRTDGLMRSGLRVGANPEGLLDRIHAV